MKRGSYFLVKIFVGIFLVASCSDKQADINYENLRKVKIGMSMPTVKEIMGKSDSIITPTYEKRIWFMYKSPSGMSDNFYIYFSSEDSVVVGINDGT